MNALPQEISLVIRHRTGGGRMATVSGGEIIEVHEDGAKRQPKSPDFNKAIFWLQKNHYVPAAFKWIDPPGYVRRRRCTYRREEEQQET